MDRVDHFGRDLFVVLDRDKRQSLRVLLVGYANIADRRSSPAFARSPRPSGASLEPCS